MAKKQVKAAPAKTETPAKPIVGEKPWPWAWILFGFSVALYANTIGHGYALDDTAVIEKNRFVQQGLQGIPSILTTFYWQGFWDLNAGLYRPLSLVMFAVEQQFFPGNSLIGHFVNVLMFGAIVVLLFKFLQYLLPQRGGLYALPVALLFAAHPIHTEVVANIKSRDELLALLFFLLAALGLFRYLESKETKWWTLSVGAYGLALFSKEASLVFIPLLAVVLYYKGEENIGRGVKLLLPYAVVAGLFVLLHEWVIRYASPPRVTYSYMDNVMAAATGLGERTATAILIMGKYFLLLLWPHPLSYDYSFNQIPLTGWGNVGAILSLLALVGLLVWAAMQWRKRTIPALAIGFFFITIAFTSNLFFLIGATMAERFLFVPSIGFCLLLVYGLVRVTNTPAADLAVSFKKAATRPLLALLLLILTGYSFKTVTRNADWKNNNTLFLADVNAAPGSYNTQYNCGTALLTHFYVNETNELRKEELLKQALVHLKQATVINDKGAAAWINLSIAHYKAKQYAEARDAALNAVRLDSVTSNAYTCLGNAHYRLNSHKDAIYAFTKAIQLGDTSEDVLRFLGASYFGAGNYPMAQQMFKRVMEVNPANYEVLTNLGSSYAITGQPDLALSCFREVLNKQPQNKQVLFYIGSVYKETGRTDSAAYYFSLSGIR